MRTHQQAHGCVPSMCVCAHRVRQDERSFCYVPDKGAARPHRSGSYSELQLQLCQAPQGPHQSEAQGQGCLSLCQASHSPNSSQGGGECSSLVLRGSSRGKSHLLSLHRGGELVPVVCAGMQQQQQQQQHLGRGRVRRRTNWRFYWTWAKRLLLLRALLYMIPG